MEKTLDICHHEIKLVAANKGGRVLVFVFVFSFVNQNQFVSGNLDT